MACQHFRGQMLPIEDSKQPAEFWILNLTPVVLARSVSVWARTGGRSREFRSDPGPVTMTSCLSWLYHRLINIRKIIFVSFNDLLKKVTLSILFRCCSKNSSSVG